MHIPINDLIEARKRKNLTLEQIHHNTKISIHHLEAIEQGHFDELPAHIATSYIRTYAQLLKVPAEPILEMFREYLAANAQPQPVGVTTNTTTGQTRSSRDHKTGFWKKSYTIAVLSLVLLAGGIWFGVSFFMTDEKQADANSQTQSSVTEEQTPELVLPTKDERASLKLIEPIEVNNKGDKYQVTNAQNIQLVITAPKPTQVEVTLGSQSGKVTKKSFKVDEKQSYTDTKSMSIKVENPNHVIISVNGNTIDTTKQSKASFYQFTLENTSD